jgi:transcriptional regulator with XRE-family HTH domain
MERNPAKNFSPKIPIGMPSSAYNKKQTKTLVAQWARKTREENRWTQEKLAEESKLQVDYIKRIEDIKEHKEFSMDTLARICKALGCILVISIEPIVKDNEL